MTKIVVNFDCVSQGQGVVAASARITGITDESQLLWYRIEADREPDELTLAHAFAVSLINIAMALGRDLVIDGPLTSGLMLNLQEYKTAWVRWMPHRFRMIDITPRGLVADEPFRPERRFVVPFSGGLDSMYTAWSLHQRGLLGALVPIHGLDIPVAEVERWLLTLEGLRDCASSLDVPLYTVQTNWNEFARQLPGYLGYFLPIVAAALLTAGDYCGIAVASGWPYDHLRLPEERNVITDPLLGRPACSVLHHGAEAHRIDKVAAIAAWPQGISSMRPCDAPRAVDGSACGRCRKCIQTAMAFLALGHPVPPSLGGAPPTIEDIERVTMTPYAALGMRDAVAAARERGIRGAWIPAAESRAAEFAAQPPPSSDAVDLRRRLDYVLGGTERPARKRILRRIMRALRGATGPRDMAPLGAPILAQPPARKAPGVEFALTSRGRRMYVDTDDLRGVALVEASGNLKPAALEVWKLLVNERRWTLIVDVGANYGEMIVDLAIPEWTRVIAVEPNPHVGWYLERTLRDGGLRVEVVRKALTDRAGAVDIMIDRTWSGLSGVASGQSTQSRHRLEPIRVDATTLHALIVEGLNERDTHLLVKVDVEGHEVSVLRGLQGLEERLGSFAALIEITQLPDTDIAWILEHYKIELLANRNNALVRVNPASPRELSSLLADGVYHANDIVLRTEA